MSDDRVYSIPARFRKIENLHILLWLLKDVCWALDLRTLGMIMIVPTLTVAVAITWQTRRLTAELVHNLAVVLWITANCLWMTGEFFGFDEGTWGARHLALIPFSIGLLILFVYYFFLLPNKGFQEKLRKQTVTMLQDEQNP